MPDARPTDHDAESAARTGTAADTVAALREAFGPVYVALTPHYAGLADLYARCAEGVAGRLSAAATRPAP